MSSWWRFFFGLDEGELPANADARLEYAASLQGGAAWFAAFLVVGAVAIIVALYRRERDLSRLRRGLLVALRLGALAIVLWMLLDPRILTELHATREAQTLLLLDTSGSMDHEEIYEGTERDALEVAAGVSLDGPRKRADLVLEILEHQNLVGRLEEQSPARLFLFDAGARAVDRIDRTSFEPPGGDETRLGDAIRGALMQAGSEPVAALVVVSDGRVNGGERVDKVAAEVLANDVPIYAVAVGKPLDSVDYRVTDLSAPGVVDVGAPIRIRGQIETAGFAESVTVSLHRQNVKGGRRTLVDQRTIESRRVETSTSCFFVDRIEGKGTYKYTLSIPPHAEEVDTSDNQRGILVSATEAESRVLLLAGSYTYEYHHLRNFLLREPSWEVSCWLSSADRGYPQDGDIVIRGLPGSADELRPYDSVLMLDPDPDELGGEFVEALRTFVLEQGGGIVFVAGETYTDDFFRAPQLAALRAVLPVETVGSASGGGSLGTPELYACLASAADPRWSGASDLPAGRRSCRQSRRLGTPPGALLQRVCPQGEAGRHVAPRKGRRRRHRRGSEVGSRLCRVSGVGRPVALAFLEGIAPRALLGIRRPPPGPRQETLQGGKGSARVRSRSLQPRRGRHLRGERDRQAGEAGREGESGDFDRTAGKRKLCRLEPQPAARRREAGLVPISFPTGNARPVRRTVHSGVGTHRRPALLRCGLHRDGMGGSVPRPRASRRPGGADGRGILASRWRGGAPGDDSGPRCHRGRRPGGVYGVGLVSAHAAIQRLSDRGVDSQKDLETQLMVTGQPSILQTLRALDPKLRRWLVWLGVSELILVLASFVLVSFALDYALHTPGVLRAVLLLFAVGLSLAIGFRAARRLRHRFRLEDLAAAVEGYDPSLDGHLINVLELPRQLRRLPRTETTEVERRLLERALAESSRLVSRVQVRRSLSAAVVLKWSALGLLSMAALVVCATSAPEAFGLWFRRNVFLSSEEWPRRTRFVLEHGGEEWHVARKDPLHIAGWVAGAIPRRVTLQLEGAGAAREVLVVPGKLGSVTIARDNKEEEVPAKRLAYIIPSLKESFQYRFEGGDNHSETVRVLVHDRPTILRASFTLRFPDYLKKEPRVIENPTEDIVLPEGSILEVEVEADMELQSGWLSLGKGDRELLDTTNSTTVRGRVTPSANGYLVMAVTEKTRNLESQPPLRFAVLVVPDQAPTVSLVGSGQDPQDDTARTHKLRDRRTRRPRVHASGAGDERHQTSTGSLRGRSADRAAARP